MPLLQTLPSGVDIECLRRVLLPNDVVLFEGDVVVRYGAEKLTADRVAYYGKEFRGVAEGNVILIDPDGTAQADRIEFGWDPPKTPGQAPAPSRRYAKAENVEIRVQGGILKARRADMLPGEWTLFDVEGTTCLRSRPLYYVTSDRVVVRPNQHATAHQPRVSVLGRFVAELPNQRFALTPAVPGLHLPTPAYKLRQGLGVTWAGGVLAGHNGTFDFNARSFQNSKPSAFAEYTRSYLPISRATEIVAPRTDFAERFYFGYFDSVLIDSPETELKFLRADRSSFSGGAQLNGSVVDRDRGTRYTKVEAVLERGARFGDFGFLGQLRAQGIKREEAGMEPRVSFAGSAGLPSYRLGDGLRTLVRLDAATFAGSTLYGWGRAMAGLTYAPARWFRLSAAGYASFDAGKPEFDIDPLYAETGTLLRADASFAGTRLSILSKDDRRRGWYDTEFSINQVIGCVEASYIVRGYPRRSQIGVTLRIEPLTDLVKRRTGKLPPPSTEGLGPPQRP